jgi:mRNA interferase RelE/StbE
VKYKIEFARAAEKQLSEVPAADLKKLVKRIDKLGENPFPSGHEKLKGHDDLYRIRQGDWRAIYAVFERKLVVLVVKIGHRREIYR